MKKSLTKRQEQIYNYICEASQDNGYPPSVREICAKVGLKSSATVYNHLVRLEEKGYIRRDPAKPRAIEILDENVQLLNSGIAKIPLVGRVTAGMPILAQENIEEYFPLPTYMVKSDTMFMLQISGESMIERGINDGDFVIVRQQKIAENGDIVVAMLDDEATVKTFYKESDHVRLQPENPAYPPIIAKNVSILGKVIGLFRQM
ncbi:transcriptional repressor LexA [Clostridium sp. 'deep sea']|uniref:transcriptional repressor LexA n=1 Tax=Clostridium sp. 'deep sea' TaxID=2779445 RepID=UPI0018965721|nr:transcriptional repressor LexA [Clostridium sp. 'deep sea']QOR35760.1 transcriptional repressor LexA [Clostridium sp. 'deep sea']